MSAEDEEVGSVKQKKEKHQLDKNLFTFKPKLNPKSNQIALHLQKSFLERQNSHVQKQLEQLRFAFIQSTNDYGKLLYPNSLLANSNISKSDYLIQKVFFRNKIFVKTEFKIEKDSNSIINRNKCQSQNFKHRPFNMIEIRSKSETKFASLTERFDKLSTIRPKSKNTQIIKSIFFRNCLKKTTTSSLN